jgi:hypothetical protein
MALQPPESIIYECRAPTLPLCFRVNGETLKIAL